MRAKTEDRLFVATSRYTRPLEEVDAHRPDHMAWLQRHYDEGRMLASGRQDPPVGGVLVLRAPDAAAARELLAGDPYVAAGVAAYEVTGFTPTPAPLRSAALEAFLVGTEAAAR
jgi:uncharacterized protein YciI